MANQVHVLWRPTRPASGVLQWLKGVTARQANLLLGGTGQPFWQRESYDHVVKQEREMERLVAYIENNPVKAGLVAERLERRPRSGLRAEARSGTLKRAPQYRLLPAPKCTNSRTRHECLRHTRSDAPSSL